MLEKSRDIPPVTLPTEKINDSRNNDPQDLQHRDNAHQLTERMVSSDLLPDEPIMPGTFWLNGSGSPCFSNVDHLLSPGFFISDNIFQPFFADYDNSSDIVDPYGQAGSALNNPPVGFLNS